jgi:hypothetical protein
MVNMDEGMVNMEEGMKNMGEGMMMGEGIVKNNIGTMTG